MQILSFYLFMYPSIFISGNLYAFAYLLVYSFSLLSVLFDYFMHCFILDDFVNKLNKKHEKLSLYSYNPLCALIVCCNIRISTSSFNSSRQKTLQKNFSIFQTFSLEPQSNLSLYHLVVVLCWYLRIR